MVRKSFMSQILKVNFSFRNEKIKFEEGVNELFNVWETFIGKPQKSHSAGNYWARCRTTCGGS